MPGAVTREAFGERVETHGISRFFSVRFFFVRGYASLQVMSTIIARRQCQAAIAQISRLRRELSEI